MSTRLSPRSRPPAPADEDDADDADRGISARAPSYLGMETGVVWGDGASSPTSGGVVYVRSHALEQNVKHARRRRRRRGDVEVVHPPRNAAPRAEVHAPKQP